MKNGYLCEEQEKCLCNIALNEVPLYIFWKDQDLIFRGCNDNFAKFLGLKSPNDIIGKTDFDLVDKESAEHFREIDKMVIKTKKAVKNITEPSGDYQKNQIWMNVNKFPLIKNNKVVGIVGTFEDVTEKKDLEGKLSKSEDKYKNLIEFTNTSYVIMNKKLKIIEVNNNFVDLMEAKSKKEIIGRNLRSWVSSKRMSSFDAAFKCLVKNNKHINDLEVLLVNEKGNKAYISVNGYLTQNGNTKIFCLISDISMRKMMQQAEFIKNQKQKDRIKHNIMEIQNQLRDLQK